MEDSLKVLGKDERFAPLIKKYGKPDLKRGNKPFQALIHSIVYQQLSGKAAGTILKRFLGLYGTKGKFPTPAQVLATPHEDMREVGLSNQKATYLKDLASKFSDGTIKEKSLLKMPSQDIVEYLVQVKGIGVWSVQMFLIFTLGHLDVLPVGDLGVRKGMQILYKLRELPTSVKMEKIAKPWRVHASIASWYLWKVADEKKK
jgi:DNA-3-methyladenine glycosylase II